MGVSASGKPTVEAMPAIDRDPDEIVAGIAAALALSRHAEQAESRP